MSGGVSGDSDRGGAVPAGAGRDEWPLWEVFLRGKRGLNHVHVGSLHAADAEMALHHARDLYTRRNEGVSIWVVPSAAITASSPEEKDPFFAPSGDKAYRHPTFYDIPADVPHM
jgi:ring-1,2-phenylacetyl-CoA epoxidase subunit PaaB